MRATAKAAARRRRSSWAAPIPTSRASCPTRWPAIRRWIRSSPGRWKRACAGRRAPSPGTPGSFTPTTRTTCCSWRRSRPGSATSRISAAPAGRGSSSALNAHKGRVTGGAGYTWLDATFQSPETVDGTGNSTNDSALAGGKGLEGTIDIEPGDRIPLIPRHMFKAFAEHPGHAEAVGGRRSHRGVRRVRARQREQRRASRTAPTTSAPARRRRTASSIIGAALPAEQAAAGARADQQRVRHATTTPPRSSRAPASRARATSSRGRSRRSAASSRSCRRRSMRPARRPPTGSARGSSSRAICANGRIWGPSSLTRRRRITKVTKTGRPQRAVREPREARLDVTRAGRYESTALRIRLVSPSARHVLAAGLGRPREQPQQTDATTSMNSL